MSHVLSNATEFTVSEISQAVRRAVEDEFGHVRVRGEISGFRGQHASGHAYFTLKDDAASIDAVVWKGNYSKLAFKPQEGLEVVATGRLTTFPRSSKYQIVIDNIEPAGAGALMALLEERRKKLLAEGLFARERKRPLPYLPRVIGVVTSPTGAVIRDILHRLADRFPSHVLVWPVRVQGETSAEEVVRAIEGFNVFEPDGQIPRPHLLIVARGGGSIEDLWGFNEEAVVRAVAASDIPVISAVGHETDTTLIDYAADMRAPTPTAAAEAAVPVRSELIAYVEDQGARQRQAARRSLASLRDRLRAAVAGLPRPADLADTPRQRLDLASTRLSGSLRHYLQARRLSFSQASTAVHPRIVRQRTNELANRLSTLGARSQTSLAASVRSSRLTFEPQAARLPGSVRRTMERKLALLERLLPHLSPQPLQAELRHARASLVPLAVRLRQTGPDITLRRSRDLDQIAKLLGTLGYRSVLARGYALVQSETGGVVTTAAALNPGEALRLTFADGDVGVTVAGAPPARRRLPRAPDRGDEQESLF